MLSSVEQQPRVGYDRNRGRHALDEHCRSGSESERNGESDSETAEIVFSQEDLASKMRQYPIGDIGEPNSLMRNLFENIGAEVRMRGREAPRMDYLDVQLHFDNIVEDNKQCEANMDRQDVKCVTYDEEEWREWSKGKENARRE